MDNLPSLVLLKIFKYLSYKDRIRASLVCSKWRKRILIDHKNQESLFIHFDLFPFNLKDSYSNQLIRYENSIKIKNLQFLQTGSFKDYFKNLKKLNIFNIEKFEINILNLGDCVNHFNQLEELSLTKLRLKERTSLNLINLKVLILKNIQINDLLELNTCKLETLICWTNIERVYLKYPKKLLNLEYKNSNLEFNQEFTNLEHLSYFDVTGLKKNDFLRNLKNLKKLIVYTPFVEHDIKELKRQKQVYKLENLQILSFGFKDEFIYFPINYNYIYLLDRFKLKELVNNYSKLTNVSFPVQIDFCSTFDNFLFNKNQSLPNDFFAKFTQIHQVNVCWSSKELIENFSPLVKFIKDCGFLQKLVLNNCAFKQSFYDQLSQESSIGQLEIKETNLDFKSYHFLSKSILFYLKVNLSKLSVELILNGLKNKNLKYLEFNYKNSRIFIKYYKNQFNLEINNQFVNRFNSLESVVNQLKDDERVNFFLT